MLQRRWFREAGVEDDMWEKLSHTHAAAELFDRNSDQAEEDERSCVSLAICPFDSWKRSRSWLTGSDRRRLVDDHLTCYRCCGCAATAAATVVVMCLDTLPPLSKLLDMHFVHSHLQLQCSRQHPFMSKAESAVWMPGCWNTSSTNLLQLLWKAQSEPASGSVLTWCSDLTFSDINNSSLMGYMLDAVLQCSWSVMPNLRHQELRYCSWPGEDRSLEPQAYRQSLWSN